MVIPLVAFFTAGFNETWTATQGTLAAGAVLLAVLMRKKGRLPLLYLVGTVVGALLMLAAPGNSVRAKHFVRMGGWEAATTTMMSSVQFIIDGIGTPGICVVFALSILFGFEHTRLERISRKESLSIYILLVSGLITSFAPALFAMGLQPPARALFVPHVMLTLMAAVAGLQASSALRRSSGRTCRLAGIAAVLLAVLVFSTALPRQVWRAQRMAQFAREWDRIDATLRSGRDFGSRTLSVDAPPGLEGLQYLDSDETHWTNRGVARWYRLHSVSRRTIPAR